MATYNKMRQFVSRFLSQYPLYIPFYTTIHVDEAISCPCAIRVCCEDELLLLVILFKRFCSWADCGEK